MASGKEGAVSKLDGKGSVFVGGGEGGAFDKREEGAPPVPGPLGSDTDAVVVKPPPEVKRSPAFALLWLGGAERGGIVSARSWRRSSVTTCGASGGAEHIWAVRWGGRSGGVLSPLRAVVPYNFQMRPALKFAVSQWTVSSEKRASRTVRHAFTSRVASPSLGRSIA